MVSVIVANAPISNSRFIKQEQLDGELRASGGTFAGTT